jgi:hypothetical protein
MKSVGEKGINLLGYSLRLSTIAQAPARNLVQSIDDRGLSGYSLRRFRQHFALNAGPELARIHCAQGKRASVGSFQNENRLQFTGFVIVLAIPVVRITEEDALAILNIGWFAISKLLEK